MQPFTGLDQVTKRYLTLIYGVILGLAAILAILAMLTSGKQGNPSGITAVGTPSIANQTESPILNVTEEHSLKKPTAIPNIPATPNEVTPSNLGVASEELAGREVSVWYPWSGATGSEFQHVLDEFNQTNSWGIKVVGRAFQDFGSLDDTMDAAVSSGTLPDVLVDYSYQAQHWEASSLLADLTPYVNDPLWGFSQDEQSDFYPVFWAEDQVPMVGSNQTRRLGIPFYRSAYVLFYNQSWAEELGYSNAPTTPQDFRRQACAAAAANADQAVKSDISRGGWLISPQPGLLTGWIYAFGGSITNRDETAYQLDAPETEQALDFIKGLLESGCAWSDPAADPFGEFTERRALFLVGSLFDIPAQQEALAQAKSSDEWTVIPFPSSGQAVVDTYGPSLLITQSDPATQLAAWLVVKWLVHPPILAEFVSQNGTYPTRQSAEDILSANAAINRHQQQALALLREAHGEPTLASWSVVRWMLNDALSQLVSPKFTTEQIPALIETMESTAAEINNQVH